MSKNKKTKYAKLSLPDGKNYKLPILSGTIGPDVIEIKNLYNDTDKFTYDPGYTSTGSCKSKITYIDGEKGILLHRGYKIDELAENCDFLEVAYLLLKYFFEGLKVIDATHMLQSSMIFQFLCNLQ